MTIGYTNGNNYVNKTFQTLSSAQDVANRDGVVDNRSKNDPNAVAFPFKLTRAVVQRVEFNRQLPLLPGIPSRNHQGVLVSVPYTKEMANLIDNNKKHQNNSPLLAIEWHDNTLNTASDTQKNNGAPHWVEGDDGRPFRVDHYDNQPVNTNGGEAVAGLFHGFEGNMLEHRSPGLDVEREGDKPEYNFNAPYWDNGSTVQNDDERAAAAQTFNYGPKNDTVTYRNNTPADGNVRSVQIATEGVTTRNDRNGNHSLATRDPQENIDTRNNHRAGGWLHEFQPLTGSVGESDLGNTTAAPTSRSVEVQCAGVPMKFSAGARLELRDNKGKWVNGCAMEKVKEIKYAGTSSNSSKQLIVILHNGKIVPFSGNLVVKISDSNGELINFPVRDLAVAHANVKKAEQTKSNLERDKDKLNEKKDRLEKKSRKGVSAGTNGDSPVAHGVGAPLDKKSSASGGNLLSRIFNKIRLRITEGDLKVNKRQRDNVVRVLGSLRENSSKVQQHLVSILNTLSVGTAPVPVKEAVVGDNFRSTNTTVQLPDIRMTRPNDSEGWNSLA